MTELIERTAVELASLLRTGAVSAREVVSAHLARIDAVNGAVNAIVSRRPDAEVLADAAALDAVPADRRGPLHGLPVAVKDLEDVAGLPTRCGSVTTSDRPARADGVIAARLRAAGAVFVGKTNTPEFGAGSHTFNRVFGTTRNPWDLSRSAGGSSGGAAAALAARMLPIADGGDLGGSLRNPAAFCNVVGMRPSIGRVPSRVDADRSTHLLRLSVRGPMGRTVADTALLLRCLAGPLAADPLSLPDPPTPFDAALATTTTARIGWGGNLGLFPVEPEVLDICHAAVERARLVGAAVVDDHPDLSSALSIFRVLRGLTYRNLAKRVPRTAWSELKDSLVDNIEYGLRLDADDILDAEAGRADLHITMTTFFERHDILALPSTQVAPFPAEWEYPSEINGVMMGDYLEWMSTCCVITPTGCPAISIPAGFTSGGLPVGVQLVAPIGHERRLLEVGAAIESTSELHRRHPAL